MLADLIFLTVHSEEAIVMSRRLALEEGLLCAISGGANACAAMKVANLPGMEGKLVVTGRRGGPQNAQPVNFSSDIFSCVYVD
uniref:Uncharacterized protein n=1 Tax=Ditylenchus dipsaci TaxID=166011 RepID=A0A915DGR6_9BILA